MTAEGKLLRERLISPDQIGQQAGEWPGRSHGSWCQTRAVLFEAAYGVQVVPGRNMYCNAGADRCGPSPAIFLLSSNDLDGRNCHVAGLVHPRGCHTP